MKFKLGYITGQVRRYKKVQIDFKKQMAAAVEVFSADKAKRKKKSNRRWGVIMRTLTPRWQPFETRQQTS